MADSLRDLIAETLAGHDVAMTRDRFLVCFCEEWRVVTTGGPLDAEIRAHREHVADALLAALGKREIVARGTNAALLLGVDTEETSADGGEPLG